MSYIINNSRGNIVAIVADGTVNTSATDLALVGRALTDYGAYQNENYVYLLENFANSTAPLQPILGQLWYNSDTDVISAYNSGNTWSALAPVVSPAFTGIPTAPTAGNGTSTTQIATTAFVLNQLGSSNSIVSFGNITGGNLLTSGLVSAAGNVTGGNINTAGLITVTGNVTGGNLLSSGLVSVAGNITSGNISTVNYSGTTLLVTGDITGGNINTSGSVSATGNVIGANFIGNVIPPAGGSVSTTGNITGGNILTSGLASVTGNITGGNINTSGLVSATGNIIGSNILTSGLASVTGNITGGNILTSGVISTTGNIASSGTVIADTVIANTVITTGSTSAFRLPNLNQTQINALIPQNGDLVYNTTDNLPQIYQSGVWRNFTISYYS